ncbi:glutathione S-transferase [Microdochium trichocladiopsis]|uniref:glutathione transferase n=1 Tax=Microdochium trichocladiopsis TaxID=1682393 RepID=A0A9P8Y5F3_9PEZI|nr:glutathione S-transferase [Microdochium trichocladiopsis]KAH7027921.1 glutathione S-transferase [Microdochium trichocladiopsis]
MTLKVHHLTVSQSERVVWLCEELGLDYELVVYERAPIFAPPEYKALHPLGAAPVIQDGDLTLAESAACVEYICQKHGNGRFIVKPTDKNYADYLYWFHFANATLQATLMRNFTFKSSGLGDDNPIVQRFTAKQNELLAFIDKRLSQAQYLAGDELTAADIMAVVSLTSMRCYNQYSLAGYDNILAYLQRVAAREGYQRALKKSDPDLNIDQLVGEAPPPLQKGIAARFKELQKSKA